MKHEKDALVMLLIRQAVIKSFSRKLLPCGGGSQGHAVTNSRKGCYAHKALTVAQAGHLEAAVFRKCL